MRFSLLVLLLVACTPPPESAPPEEAVDEVPDDPPPTGTFVPEGYAPFTATRAIFLGDSLTHGAGASTGALNYRNLLVSNVEATWPDYLGRDLSTLAPDLVDLHDVSFGGATTSTMVSYQLDEMEESVGGLVEGPSIAVFTIGGNDMQLALASFLAQGTDAADERVQLLLDNLHLTIDALTAPERFPDGTMVYLANVYEPTDGVGQVEECFGGLDLRDMLSVLEDTNLAIRALAVDRGVAMIDLRAHFRGHGFYAEDPELPEYDVDDPSQWLGEDCIHPNDRGHHELRRLFFGAMEGDPLPRR